MRISKRNMCFGGLALAMTFLAFAENREVRGQETPGPAPKAEAVDPVAESATAEPAGIIEAPEANSGGDREEMKASEELVRSLPEEFEDASFNRYVDLLQLVGAVKDANVVAITDLGLQLAEGERVLLRPHQSGITSAHVLDVAIKLAVAKKDAETLKRVRTFAQQPGKKALLDIVDAAEKLAGQSRGPDPALSVSLEKTDAETIGNMKRWLSDLETARAIGDLNTVTLIRDSVSEVEGTVTEEQKKAILARVEEAVQDIEGSADENMMIEKLMGASRGNNMGDQQATIKKGWTDVVWGPHFDHKSQALMLAMMASPAGPAASAGFLTFVSRVGTLIGARDVAVQLIRQRGTLTRGNKEWNAGIATYNHWAENKVPTLTPPNYKWIKTSLPNTFQPYVRYRIVGSGSGGGGATTSQVISYTLTNKTKGRVKVEFLPTQNVSYVDPGKTLTCRSPMKNGEYPQLKAYNSAGAYWLRTIKNNNGKYEVIVKGTGVQVIP